MSSKYIFHYFDTWRENGWSMAGPRCRDGRAAICKITWRGVTCKKCLKLKGKKKKK